MDGDGVSDAAVIFAAYLATVPAYSARAGLLFGFLLLVDVGFRDHHRAPAHGAARHRRAGHARRHGLSGPSSVWSGSRYIALGFTSAFVAVLSVAPPWPVVLATGRPGRARAGRVCGAASAVRRSRRWPASSRLSQRPGHSFSLFSAAVAVRLAGDRAGKERSISSPCSLPSLPRPSWSTGHLTIARLPTAVALYAIFGVTTAIVPMLARASRPRLHRTGPPGRADRQPGAAALSRIGRCRAGGVVGAGAAARDHERRVSSSKALSVGLPSSRSSAASLLGDSRDLVDARRGSVGMLAVTGRARRLHARHPRPATSGRIGTARAWSRVPLGAGDSLFGRSFPGADRPSVPLGLSSNPDWSMPPWPLFGTLAVMTLATSVASLAVTRAALHVSGIVAASLIVLTWMLDAGRGWGLVGLLAAAGVSAFALAWRVLRA